MLIRINLGDLAMKQISQTNFHNSDAFVEACSIYRKKSAFFDFTEKGWEEIKQFAPYALEGAHKALQDAKHEVKNAGAYFFQTAFRLMQAEGQFVDKAYAQTKMREQNISFMEPSFINVSREHVYSKADLGNKSYAPSKRASSQIHRNAPAPFKSFAEEKAVWLAIKQDPVLLKGFILAQRGVEGLEALAHSTLFMAAKREGIEYDFKPIFVGIEMPDVELPTPQTHLNKGDTDVVLNTPHGRWVVKTGNSLCSLGSTSCNGTQCRACRKPLIPLVDDPALQAAIDDSLARAQDPERQTLGEQQEALGALAQSLATRFKFE